MIVWRQVYSVKPGCAQDFMHLLQEIWGWLDNPVPHRIYMSMSGVVNRVVQEIEFEKFEEQQKFVADVFSRPEWPAARDRWQELEEVGTSQEFFRLVE
jgi:hypothetical protein